MQDFESEKLLPVPLNCLPLTGLATLNGLNREYV